MAQEADRNNPAVPQQARIALSSWFASRQHDTHSQMAAASPSAPVATNQSSGTE
jgi:hypothetical protein